MSAVDSVGTAPFTRVPHSLLRGDARFDEPLDFMVYMHLFTFSHGFGRQEAHMSQAQLERFTGAAKNTIKRSLDRLSRQGWIKCIEEYECARMSRKWKVIAPEAHRARSGGSETPSKPDSVLGGQGSKEPRPLATMDTRTVSKLAPFKERDPKERSENSLSPILQPLQDYFTAVKPFGKRESEWKAYLGLRRDFEEAQISDCLTYLLENGVPGSSQPCHSPMGFLAKGMGQVCGEVKARQEKQSKAEARVRAEAEAERKRQVESEAAEQEALAREEAFKRAFPTGEDENQAYEKYGKQFAMIARNGPVLRSLVIGAWWEDLSK